MSIYLLDVKGTLQPVAQVDRSGVVSSATAAAGMLLDKMKSEYRGPTLFDRVWRYKRSMEEPGFVPDDMAFYQLNCQFAHEQAATGEVLAHVGVVSDCIVAIVLSPRSGFTINTFLIDLNGVCHRSHDGGVLMKYTQRIVNLIDRATDRNMLVRVQTALRDVYTNANIDVPTNQLGATCEPPCLRNLRTVFRSGPSRSMRDWMLPRGEASAPKQQQRYYSKKQGDGSSDCASKANCPNGYATVWKGIGKLQKHMPGFDIADHNTWPRQRVPMIADSRSNLRKLMRAVHDDRCNAASSPDCVACCKLAIRFLVHLMEYY